MFDHFVAHWKKLASGHLPILGKYDQINSYQTEVYASLTSLLSTHHYVKYFSLLVHNNIIPLCDNNAYAIKFQRILKVDFHLRSMICTNEEEA